MTADGNPDRSHAHLPRISHVWSPETIEDIRRKAELGRYVFGAFSTSRRLPSFDDLTFIPCTLSRVPLEGYRERCETHTVLGTRSPKPVELSTPIAITGMRFGALPPKPEGGTGGARHAAGT